MSEDLVLKIGLKQDYLREVLAELEDLIGEYETDENRNIDDAEDIQRGVWDIQNDCSDIERKIENILNEIEEE